MRSRKWYFTVPGKKSGVAIEMAISFMAIVFAFCTILLTVALSIRTRDRRTSEYTNQLYVLDQIGEYFVQGVREKNDNFLRDILAGEGVNESNVSPEDLARYEIRSYEGEANEQLHTLKIWDKNSSMVKADGTIDVDNSDPIFIVSVEENRTGRVSYFTIRNWSDQLNSNENYDGRKDNSHLWLWLLALLLVLLVVTIVVIVII